MAKVQRKWIDLDPTTGLRAQDIPYSDTLSTADAINSVGVKFNNLIADTNDYKHTAETDDDTIYFVGNGIKVYGEVVDGKKIIRLDLISNLAKQCFEITSTNETQVVWDIDDEFKNGRVTGVSINGLAQNEVLNYTVTDTGIILEDGLIQDGDILCISYPASELTETEKEGIGGMIIGDTFIVGGEEEENDGIGDMIIGDTFIIN